MNKLYLSILVMVSTLSLSCVSLSFAGTGGEAADYLVKIGEMHLQDGQIQDAIHEFSRALMIQPNHHKAQKYLSSYELNDGLYRKIEPPVSLAPVQEPQPPAQLVSDLEKDTIQAKMAMQAATEENVSIKSDKEQYEKVLEVSASDERQIRQMQRDENKFKQFVVDQANYHSQLIGALEDYLSVREDQMEDLKDSLILAQIDLARNQLTALAITQELIALNDVYDRYTDRLQARGELISQKSDDIQFLTSKLEDLRQDLAERQKMIAEQETKISMLEKQLSQAK